MDLRPFKLYRVYLKPRNSSNVGEFSLSWILNDFIHVQIEKEQLFCRKTNCFLTLSLLSSLITQGRRRLEWTISCKSLYFVHPSLNFVPLVAFECRLRGSNLCELITIWLCYFVYKNTCNKTAKTYGWLWILCNSVIVWQLSMPQNEIKRQVRVLMWF